MPLVSRTFDQLIDFSRTSAATYVDATGKIVTTPASRNLLTYTQEFDNAAWSKANATVTANATISPDGSANADLVVENTATGLHEARYSFTFTGSTTYTLSVYAKASNRNILLYLDGFSGGYNFNLANGTVGAVEGTAPTSASITNVGNGWYRCSITFTWGATSTTNFLRFITVNGTTLSYTGDGTSGIFIWGAQLEAVPAANLTLGSELVTNGDFAGGTTTGWTAAGSATLSVSSGAMVVTNGATAFGLAYQGFTTVVGQTYRASWQVTGGSVPGTVYIGTTPGGFENYNSPNLSAGTYTINFVATATTTYIRVGTSQNTSGATSSFDNISVKQITAISGIPSTYTRNVAGLFPPRFDYDPVTLAPKGLLVEEQRTNLLVRSEEFDNASWTKSNATVTANATTSPDGTADADKLVEAATTSAHTLQQNAAVSSGAAYTFSVYAKAAERSQIQIQYFDGTTNKYPVFSLVDGTKVTDNGIGTAWTSTSVGNGWWRFTITATSAGTTAQCNLYPATGGTNSYTGDGTSGIFVYGAQLEAGSFATSYIPTVASQVTRTADVAAIVAPNFAPWFNADAGTLVVSATGYAAPTVAQGGAAPTAASLYATPASSPYAAISVGRRDSSPLNSPNGYITSDTGATQADLPISTVSWSGNTVTAAIAWSGNTDAAFTANGATPGTDASYTRPTSIDSLQIGRFGSEGVTAYWSGHIRSIRYYPTRLTNAQLQALTA